MVRQFDLPWQPVAKRKQRELFEEMSKDQSFTSPNYQGPSKCLALRVNPEGDTMMAKNEEDNSVGNRQSLVGKGSNKKS